MPSQPSDDRVLPVSAPGDGEDRLVADFVSEWFADLSEHVPVDRLLPKLSKAGLEMVFLERTLRSHADFVDWYEEVGTAYVDQTHSVGDIEIGKTSDESELIPVNLIVLWARTLSSDGTRKAFRVSQTWRLRRAPEDRLLIVTYHVVNQEATTAEEA